MSCCLSRCRSRSNSFWRDVVELLFDAALFAKRQFLGLDLGLLVAGGGLDFRLFEDRLGFFFRIAFAQIAQQFEQPHPHAGGNGGDDDDDPRIGVRRLRLRQHRQSER